MAPRGQKATNKWVARIIPVILVAIFGYSAYVMTKVIAIDYLIKPSPYLLVQPRPGSAAAILLFYYLLLIPVLICYARLIQIIVTNPGYVPHGAAWYQRHREEVANKQRSNRGHHRRRRPASQSSEKPLQPPQTCPPSTEDLESGGSNHSSLTTTLKKHTAHYSFNHGNQNSSTTSIIPFWHRDIFICNSDGRSPFCSTCLTHKPDRTHHCSEVDRCVLKMDHFCPWVGGIVSETSFKFFIQFLVYAALFCLMVLTTIAIFISERRKKDSGFLNVHYFLLLGLAALFLLFTMGMAGSSIQLALVNSTTVENLNRRSKVWWLAVLIPRGEGGSLPPLPPPTATRQGGGGGVSTGARFQTITYPRPAEEDQFLIHQSQSQIRTQNAPPTTTTTVTTNPLSSIPTNSSQQQQQRTFAILPTRPGENPFDIGPWNNIREVMGYSFAEWVFPVRMSPCAMDHGSRVSAFKMDWGLVRRLREEAGLVGRGRGSPRGERGGRGGNEGTGAEDYESRRKRRRRRRRRRRSSTTTTPTTTTPREGGSGSEREKASP